MPIKIPITRNIKTMSIVRLNSFLIF
jgi:hypothetical protein